MKRVEEGAGELVISRGDSAVDLQVTDHALAIHAPVPADFGLDCEVLVVEPYERLSYSWNASGEEAAGGLKTVVTWTLTPVKGGVLVRMEQSGFRPQDEAGYQGARYGWQRFVGGLERVVAGLE